MLKNRPAVSFEAKGAVGKKEKSVFFKIVLTLGSIFFVIWITIGLFLVLIIIQGIRRGDFIQLLSSSRQAPAVEGAKVPSETTIPGVGRVNIACVQEALSPESIQKLVSDSDSSFLQGEEKTKFEACVLEPESSPKTQE